MAKDEQIEGEQAELEFGFTQQNIEAITTLGDVEDSVYALESKLKQVDPGELANFTDQPSDHLVNVLNALVQTSRVVVPKEADPENLSMASLPRAGKMRAVARRAAEVFERERACHASSSIASIEHPERNEDSMVAQFGLQATFDGMGGHKGGEVASTIAKAVLEQFYYKAPLGEGLSASKARITAALEAANREIYIKDVYDSKQKRPISNAEIAAKGLWDKSESDGLIGTTALVCKEIQRPQDLPIMLVGSIGDSPAYLIREGQVLRINLDDSPNLFVLAQGITTEFQGRTDFTEEEFFTAMANLTETYPYLEPALLREKVMGRGSDFCQEESALSIWMKEKMPKAQDYGLVANIISARVELQGRQLQEFFGAIQSKEQLGQITEEEIAQMPEWEQELFHGIEIGPKRRKKIVALYEDRNIIYKSLGTQQEMPRPNFDAVVLQPGDAVLSGSDGLSDNLMENEIADHYAESKEKGLDLAQTSDLLTQKTYERSQEGTGRAKKDDITVQIAEVPEITFTDEEIGLIATREDAENAIPGLRQKISLSFGYAGDNYYYSNTRLLEIVDNLITQARGETPKIEILKFGALPGKGNIRAMIEHICERLEVVEEPTKSPEKIAPAEESVSLYLDQELLLKDAEHSKGEKYFVEKLESDRPMVHLRDERGGVGFMPTMDFLNIYAPRTMAKYFKLGTTPKKPDELSAGQKVTLLDEDGEQAEFSIRNYNGTDSVFLDRVITKQGQKPTIKVPLVEFLTSPDCNRKDPNLDLSKMTSVREMLMFFGNGIDGIPDSDGSYYPASKIINYLVDLNEKIINPEFDLRTLKPRMGDPLPKACGMFLRVWEILDEAKRDRARRKAVESFKS